MHHALFSRKFTLPTGMSTAIRLAARYLRTIFEIDVRTYRPERHYMRGPGPQWHKKHESARADSFFS
jgi:hypothetical protein